MYTYEYHVTLEPNIGMILYIYISPFCTASLQYSATT